jgi:hypothetical protein
MFVRWPRAFAWGLAIASFAVFAAPASAVPAMACPVAPGDKIVLASQGLDPDVFVWDSATRLVAYAQGDYDTDTVLKHTVLAKPGTSALTTDCRPAPASPNYTKGELDLVGVKLTSGPNRGRYGWVAAEDVRRPDGKPVTVYTP